MSWIALGWSETVPVADVYERVILMQMAARASDDGTGVWPSLPTLAGRAVSDEKTVKRRLNALVERGVIAYGDQKLAAHIRADRRPNVYDLMIPFSYYSTAQLVDVNRQRAEGGLAPLTAADRPDLPDAEPSRKKRSDNGVPRPPRALNNAEDQPLTVGDAGGLVVQGADGGSPSPQTGGLVVRDGGASRPPNLSLNRSAEPVPFSHTSREAEAASPCVNEPVVIGADLFLGQDRDPDESAASIRGRRPSAANRAAEGWNKASGNKASFTLVNAYCQQVCQLPIESRNQLLPKVTSLLHQGFEQQDIFEGITDVFSNGLGLGHLANKVATARFRRTSAPQSTTSQRVQETERLRAQMRAMDVAEESGQLGHFGLRAIGAGE